jgi:hypothetical protein
MGWGGQKNFSSRTTEPEYLRFIWKLPDIVQIQACTNYGPRALERTTIGEAISTCVYWIESFKLKHLANFNQTWYKPFLHEENSSLFKWRTKSSSKGGIITKVQK